MVCGLEAGSGHKLLLAGAIFAGGIMAMVMMTFVIVMMAVVFTAPWRRGQPAIQKGGGQFFHRRSRRSGADGDAVLCKNGQRPPPDAAGDHDLRALLAQPARKKSGRVRRRNHRALVENRSPSGIHLNEGKFPAAAEMFMKPAVGRGKSNRHVEIIQHFDLHIK